MRPSIMACQGKGTCWDAGERRRRERREEVIASLKSKYQIEKARDYVKRHLNQFVNVMAIAL